MILRLVTLVFGVLLMFIGPASGHMIDSKSVVGTWVGILDIQAAKGPRARSTSTRMEGSKVASRARSPVS
jgi:hypothetical protein